MSNSIEKGQSLTSPSHAGVSALAAPAPKTSALSLREADRVALRPVVAEIESEMASLQTQASSDTNAQTAARLTSHWRRLVDILALGTPPELRSCPHCGYSINSAATRCIQCWKQSPGKPRGLT